MALLARSGAPLVPVQFVGEDPAHFQGAVEGRLVESGRGVAQLAAGDHFFPGRLGEERGGAGPFEVEFPDAAQRLQSLQGARGPVRWGGVGLRLGTVP